MIANSIEFRSDFNIRVPLQHKSGRAQSLEHNAGQQKYRMEKYRMKYTRWKSLKFFSLSRYSREKHHVVAGISIIY